MNYDDDGNNNDDNDDTYDDKGDQSDNNFTRNTTVKLYKYHMFSIIENAYYETDYFIICLLRTCVWVAALGLRFRTNIFTKQIMK